MIKFRKAVLIIHGFAGGTYDLELLANHLELNRKLDVYSFTLPGHDVKCREKATGQEWIKEGEKQLKFLIDNGYKQIYIVGHSMGGVIASYLATKYKEVKRLVLAAPAFSHLAAKEEGGVLGALGKGPDILRTYSTDEFLTRIRKLPISAVREFLRLVEKYQYVKKEINIPVMIIHGEKDQIVPTTSSTELYDEIKTNKKELLLIKGYYHDLFRGSKAVTLSKEIENFLIKPKFRIKESRKDL